jgi:carbon-monoxide dehydrogenase small subunit
MNTISPVLNGVRTSVAVSGSETLLSMLRDRLGLLGTKEGCNEGECGACTVLVDGTPVDSCIYPAAATDGCEVTTVEGLGRPDALSPLQDAFVASGSVQCGFCTPGFLVTLTALLQRSPHPSRDEVKNALAGNICRCTGYSQILEAVDMVAGTAESGIRASSGGAR